MTIAFCIGGLMAALLAAMIIAIKVAASRGVELKTEKAANESLKTEIRRLGEYQAAKEKEAQNAQAQKDSHYTGDNGADFNAGLGLLDRAKGNSDIPRSGVELPGLSQPDQPGREQDTGTQG
jgi:biopolymer transport protein ExbB/TolQ